MKIEELVKVIQESRGLFGENELAYLSLTSKNESAIRDRIAYKLHLELKNSIVAREYSIKGINSRIDLAVLEDNDIKDIIELKSMYTFDAVDVLDKFIDSVNRDFDKNSILKSNTTSQFAIIIGTHPRSIPNEQYKNFVKYYNSIKRYMKKINNNTDLIDKMDNKVRNAFKQDKYEVKNFTMYVGNAFEVDVDICFWIVEKK
ncbi:MAG: hypothetical protein ACRCYC_08875 [Paraclostridium sp.]|uniref:hypothetical protein n=1 Tax=Paraclostridium sp. TaxID=2023273 RepID=UPI003F2CF5CF